jgi:Leucine-rich repeat (LRR) protein
VSNNLALTNLNCAQNQLTSLDVSNNTALTDLGCYQNQLTSLDVSTNTALTYLGCSGNQLTMLDVSTNTTLTVLECDQNLLTILDVKNGNNVNFYGFEATNNPNLTCIQVDDAVWSTVNWTNIDPTASFSEDCNYYTDLTENYSTIVNHSMDPVVYPNPANLSVTVQFKEEISGYYVLSFSNLINSQVMSRTMNAEGVKELSVSTFGMPNGVYILTITSENLVTTKKVIIQH